MSDNFKPYKVKTNEEYMSEGMKTHIEKILLKRKSELMEEVDKTVDHMKHDASLYPDPNDRATQEEEFSLELRTRDRERKLLNKIDLALHNLSSKSFGYCQRCGEKIGISRLEARPMATLCINCKQLEENNDN
jgi:DnaK suppressor protein